MTQADKDDVANVRREQDPVGRFDLLKLVFAVRTSRRVVTVLLVRAVTELGVEGRENLFRRRRRARELQSILVVLLAVFVEHGILSGRRQRGRKRQRRGGRGRRAV